MARRLLCTGLVGSALLLVTIAGCEVRVGTGGPPPTGDDGTSGVTTACSREGSETALSFGAGSSAFAWLWDTDHYVVVYENPAVGSGDIYVATMGPDGTVINAPVDIQSTPAASDLPSITKTSNGYLVAWQEGTAGQAVYVHALDGNAAPTGSGASVASTQSNQSRPVLAPAPNGQVAVTWMDASDGKGGAEIAFVDPSSLAVTGPQAIAQSDIDGWPWVAGDGQVLGVAWSDESSSNYQIDFASVDQSLSLANQCTFKGVGKDDQLLPRLVRTSYGFFAAWEDENDDANQIECALVDPNGNILGGGLVEEPNTGDADWPNVAWDGDSSAIVYYQFRTSRVQVYMTLLDSTGKRVNGSQDLQVSNGSTGWSKYPDIQWTGNDYGVMYVDTRSGNPALYLQRITCTTTGS